MDKTSTTASHFHTNRLWHVGDPPLEQHHLEELPQRLATFIGLRSPENLNKDASEGPYVHTFCYLSTASDATAAVSSANLETFIKEFRRHVPRRAPVAFPRDMTELHRLRQAEVAELRVHITIQLQWKLLPFKREPLTTTFIVLRSLWTMTGFWA